VIALEQFASPARLDTGLELLSERAPAGNLGRVLATVVATAGSTYRKPGARMLIMADGSYLGLLSGGCLEADLKLHAREVLEGAPARAVEYDMRGPDDVLFGIGAGCEGAMRVLLEHANSADRAGAGHRHRCIHLPRVRARIERPSTRHLQHGARRCCDTSCLGRGGAGRPHGRVIPGSPHRARGLAAARLRRVPGTSSAPLVVRRRARCTAGRGSRSRAGMAGIRGRSSAGLR
jgi:xanthine/CO dehydrogenase XdhC/CoxF family maturation factor